MSENKLKTKLFKNVFSEVHADLDRASGLSDCVLDKIKANTENRSIEVCMISDRPVCITEICKAEKLMKSAYAFSKVNLKVKLSDEVEETEYFSKESQDPINYLCERFPATRGVLQDATTDYKDGVLQLNLACKGSKLLKARGCETELANYLANMFGHSFKIKINDGERESNYSREELLSELTVNYNQNLTQDKSNSSNVSVEKKPAPAKNNVRKIKYKRKSIVEDGGQISTNSGDAIILGKDFEADYLDIKDITVESGTVAFKGEILNLETRKVGENGLLVTFDVTDYSSAVQVKFFADENDEEYVNENIKKGRWIRLYGDAQYDKYTRDVSVRAKSIVEFHEKIREDNAPVKRVELHLHTKMSSMDGMTSVGKLVERAAYWGHKAIAITDHGVVQAYPEAYAAGKKHNIKILYGVECYLVDDSKAENKEEFDWKKAKSYHAIILVKNQVGLKNLYKLVSEAHMKYYYRRPRITKSLLDQYREGLILGSACEAGEVYKAILENNPDLVEIANYYDYLEIQPLGNNEFLVRNNNVQTYEDLKSINIKIIELADSLGKPCVATCDVHFMDPKDEIFRRILFGAQGYTDADKQAPLFLRTTEEMLDEFTYLSPEKAYEVVVTNTNLIADMIDDIAPVPEGTFSPKIEGAEEDIKNMSFDKARSIYGDDLPEIVQKRLDKELNSIIKNGFSVMYIIAQKLVAKSLSDGYLVGSRGSVGSSFVANMTGITEVNSLHAHYVCGDCKYSEFIEDSKYDCGFDLPPKDCPNCGKPLIRDGYDIPFETFLGFDGEKAPDIDLNFSGEYQAKAHKYTGVLFGEDHVFKAGTISTIADKTAMGFVIKYYEEKGIHLSNANKNWLSSGVSGVKRTTGQHPGGIMIVPMDKEIYDFSPIQRPADDVNSDITTTHFDYHFLHDSILKLDILGHDDPTVIRMLEDITGIDATKIPIGEEKTMSLFSSVDALGVTPEQIGTSVGTLAVPEFGTSFVRQMLEDTRPKQFSDLIKISGLSHGTDVWINNAQTLIKDGICTLSDAICCRDDIMIYLIKCNIEPKISFKIMEDVRKGRGLKDEYIGVMKEHGVPDWYIDSCNKIKYMFPKAHAAAYVMMAFRIAWFKVYYPEAFYAAFFSVRADEFDIESIGDGSEEALMVKTKELQSFGKDISPKDDGLLKVLDVVNEMYCRGIKFTSMDLYKSDARRFIVTPEGLLPPFNSIQGLGTSAAERITEERNNGEFISIEDFKARTKVSKTVVESMKNLGCFEGMPETSQLTLLDMF